MGEEILFPSRGEGQTMSEAPQCQPVSSECHEHCQYAMDVGIPEYSCTNGCMYAARGVEQRNRDIIRRARRDHRVNEELEIDDDTVIVAEGDDNGAWVSCWMWVDFSGTPLSKEQA